MLLNHLNQPTVLVISAIVMLMALMFHNVAQAYVARRLGDLTASYQGFGRFDPQTHLDPMGVLLLRVLGFGWTKPIPVNSRNYRGRSEALVWYAGPASYLLVATASWVVAVVLLRAGGGSDVVGGFWAAGQIAILHAVVQIIPVFPLDGARAVLAWGPREVRRVVEQVAQFGFIGFIVVFMLLSYTGVLGSVTRFFTQLIIGGIQALFSLFN